MKKEFEELLSTDPESINGWKLLGRIGKGGFGTIYVGEKNSERAAIKIISKEYINDEESFKRFGNEISNLSKLNHPNIARIIESDISTNVPYIAVEFLQGKTLEEIIKTKGPLSENIWLEYLKAMSSALMYCHSKNIIHKDLSSTNIIITSDGPKLIDFGFSFSKGNDRITSIEQTVGTPPFMSPEHINGNEPTEEMDVFSLASVFAYAASDSLPFPGESRREFKDLILFRTPSFENLTEIQRTLLTPMFYKNPKLRPTFIEINDTLNKLLLAQQIDEYKLNLKNSRTKLVASERIELPKRKLKNLLTAVFVAVLAISGFILFLTNQTVEASDCQKNYDNKNYEQAIITCAFDVSNGNLESAVILGKAYKKNNQIEQAKEVFANCKNTSFECLSENAFYITDVSEARADWVEAFENGVTDAAIALAVSYNKTKETKLAETWTEKAISRGSEQAKFMKVAYLVDKKEYKPAISLAKQLIEVDPSDLPGDLKGFNVLGLIVDIYELDDDPVGADKFLKSCAKNNSYCVGELALNYYDNEDSVNAKEWALRGVELNNADSMWVMARLEERKYFGKTDSKIVDTTKAQYWFLRAANAGDVSSMWRTAGFKILSGNRDEACVWWNKTITRINERKGTLAEQQGDISWAKDSADNILKWKCGSEISISASPASTKAVLKPKSGTQSSPILQPSPSFSGFGYSEAISEDVKIDSKFGRAYLSSDGLNWLIPITNNSLESIPPVNRVQFKNASETYGSWWNTTYTLKKGSNGAYAEVSNVGLQLLHSRNGEKVCPEFRLALVENNQVTYIWNKSVEPCTP